MKGWGGAVRNWEKGGRQHERVRERERVGERCSLPHSASLAASILELSVTGVLGKEEDQKIPVRRKDIEENVTSAGISRTSHLS